MTSPMGLPRDEEGAISVEMVFVLPVLIWVLAAIHVFWDGYRASALSVKATSTLAEMVSRRTVPMNEPYVDGLRGMLDVLASGGQAGGQARDGEGSLRVSVLRSLLPAEMASGTEPTCGPPHDTVALEWSRAAGPALDPVASVDALCDTIPVVAPGDQVVVLESRSPWRPLFASILEARDMTATAVTRHRFGHRFCWEACS